MSEANANVAASSPTPATSEIVIQAPATTDAVSTTTASDASAVAAAATATTATTTTATAIATNEQEEAVELSKETLTALSRQLEYYFSSVNLSKDTYLRTLRELNDGYVPATILANFAKVQQLCFIVDTATDTSYNGVIQAATDYSDFLEVVHVDKETSKKVPESESGINTLLAIGTKDSKPIQMPPTTTTPTTLPRPTVNLVDAPIPDLSPPASEPPNTVILREVPEGVTEDDVRLLFDFEKCPPIQDVHADLSNYWFVTFSSSSRDDMMNVMLALRSKTLKGESVKSRLKSGSTMPANVDTPQIYAGDRNLPYNPKAKGLFIAPNNNNINKKKLGASPTSKKSTRRNTRRNGSSSGGSVTSKGEAAISQAPPPPLVESQFPSLEATVVVKPANVDDAPFSSSDGASTATTSTSSSVVGEVVVNKPKVVAAAAAPGGYAAALLKAKPPAAAVKESHVKPSNSAKTTGKKRTNGKKGKDAIPKVIQQEKPEKKAVETKAMSWGGGRSFADVIKKVQTSS